MEEEYICDKCGNQLEPIPDKKNTYACRYCFDFLIEAQRRHGKVKAKSPFGKLPYQLPTFKGYTVDVKLRQFRKVCHKQPSIEFIDFDSEKGKELLKESNEFERTERVSHDKNGNKIIFSGMFC